MTISHILCMLFGAGCLYAWQAYKAHKEAAGVVTEPTSKAAPEQPNGHGNPGPIDPQ